MSVPHLTIWDRDDCRRIHEATMDLLDDPGVEVKYPPALEVLSGLGARIDGTRVRMGAELVERALATAPRSHLLEGACSGSTLFLKQGESYFGTGSDCLYVTDPVSGKRRRAKMCDIEGMAALCDQLEHIDFVMSMGLPQDAPSAIDDVSQVAAMLRGTRKPLIVAPRDGGVVPIIRDMAEACGLADGLMIYAMPSPPLMHDADALSKLFACAELRIPLVYAPAPAAGGTAPASLTATITVGNAETLSGLVVHQALSPGAPFVYGAGCGVLDLRTALDVYAAPEHLLGNHAACELAAFYGLPSFAYAGVSDSKLLDGQLAAEYGFTVLLGALSKATLLHDVGYLESGLRGSFETIVLGNELVGFARSFLQDCRVDEESLALDEVLAVGPGGSHLGRKYTRSHYRSFWQPSLHDHQNHERWSSSGSSSLADRLRDLSRLLRDEPRAFVLSEDQVARLEELLAQAAAERTRPVSGKERVQ
jgi:trimethylamine---corrinoid protein Co-methyltransferase